MTKTEAMAMGERINEMTLREMELLDELWLLSKEAAELRLKTIAWMREL